MVKRYKHTPQRMRENAQGNYVHIASYQWLQTCKDSTDSSNKILQSNINKLRKINVNLLNTLEDKSTILVIYHIGLIGLVLIHLSQFLL